jgi:hypothetical protein
MRTYSVSHSPSLAALPNASKPFTAFNPDSSNGFERLLYISVRISRSADHSTSSSTHQIGGSDEDGDRLAKLEASVIMVSASRPGSDSSSSSSRLRYDIADTSLSSLYVVLAELHPRSSGSEIYQALVVPAAMVYIFVGAGKGGDREDGEWVQFEFRSLLD